TAYLTWNRIHEYANASPYFSRTTDGGLTWSAPVLLPIVPDRVPCPTVDHPFLVCRFNAGVDQIKVLPDGSLITVFGELAADLAPPPTPSPPTLTGPTDIFALISTNQGDTWSDQPVFITEVPANTVKDPDNGKGLGRGLSFVPLSAAVGPSGEIYVAWHLVEP